MIDDTCIGWITFHGDGDSAAAFAGVIEVQTGAQFDLARQAGHSTVWGEEKIAPYNGRCGGGSGGARPDPQRERCCAEPASPRSHQASLVQPQSPLLLSFPQTCFSLPPLLCTARDAESLSSSLQIAKKKPLPPRNNRLLFIIHTLHPRVSSHKRQLNQQQWSTLAAPATLAVLPATRYDTRRLGIVVFSDLTAAQARDCPTKGPAKCYNCGGEGHMSRDCPEPLKDNKSCYKCGQAGHISRDCPLAGGSGQATECYKCGEMGHIARNCTKAGFGGSYGGGGAGGFGGGAGKTCYSCGGYGHMSRECVNGMKCYNCGESGHYSRDCPKESAGGEKICYKCQQAGHVQAQCPNN
ncbi:hypothetical protein PCL_05335 [Purpureocillium lilacinum]|uniref:CCHC-type domain-containing protein n=1 Tax=Purpureocillium lilacinum TaxID=33203 RepID=A0A2U3DV31_PURLI|nr:hypothetical protein PCL_05335 [Purpureocillium lilacinum]